MKSVVRLILPFGRTQNLKTKSVIPLGKGDPAGAWSALQWLPSIFKKYPIDIHTGGVDLRFPHHDNEIA